jgi:hypothetical protein
MDLFTTERSNGTGQTWTKAGALGFFLLAGALLVASLLMPPAGPLGPTDGAPGTTASIR